MTAPPDRSAKARRWTLADENRRVDVGFVFRCTFCKKHIQHPITAKALGLGPEEAPVMGKLYRYGRCYCGFGRFVMAERTGMSEEELEEKLSEHMAH